MRFSTKHFVSVVLLIWLGGWATSALAQQCPQEGISAMCCAQYQPADDLPADQGGYAWYPGPSDRPGLCQGYAWQDVSGAIVRILDFRETPTFSTLPEEVHIGYRTLANATLTGAFLSGFSYSTGNTYVVAGSFETVSDIIWNTAPFMAAGQAFENFGFVAYARYAGYAVYTPLVFRPSDAMTPQRDAATMALRTNSSIETAAVWIAPIDAQTLRPVVGATPRVLAHQLVDTRTLVLTVPTDAPQVFVLSVVICAATASGCQATPAAPPSQRFRILWPIP